MIDIMFVVWRLFCNKMVSVQLFQAYVKKYFKLGNSWVIAKSIHFVLGFFHLQRYLARTVEKVPKELEKVLDQETFTKARLYSLDKSTYGFWSGLYHQVETTVRRSYSVTKILLLSIDLLNVYRAVLKMQVNQYKMVEFFGFPYTCSLFPFTGNLVCRCPALCLETLWSNYRSLWI